MGSKERKAQDMAKRVQDKLADYRAKGMDVREVHPIHPGGISEVLRHVDRNFSESRDSAQQQQESSRTTKPPRRR